MHEHDESNRPELHPDTIAVAAGRPPHTPGAPVNFPIGLSTTFHAGVEGHGYVREGTVATEALESAIGQLEHGYSVVFSSGLATVSAVVELLPIGAKVVAPNHAYPGTNVRLRQFAEAGRIQLTEVLISDTAAVLAASVDADLIWLETPTNPLMEVADIRAVIAAKPAAALVAVDNTFMSPVFQKPLELGADISMHSATKSIAGHSDSLLGVLTARNPEIADRLKRMRLMQGSFPGALEVFLGLRGLRTMPLRVRAATANAMEIARRLESHPQVEFVLYPGLSDSPGHELHFSQASGAGSVVSVVIKGNAEDAERVCASTFVWAHATSLGGVESTLERRRRWPAEPAVTPETLLRLSVGVEHLEDLWNDLNQALG